MPGDPHGWNDLEQYLATHESRLAQYEGYFLLENDLKFEFMSQTALHISGRLTFLHGLYIAVDKWLEGDERNRVRTVRYSYHAGVAGRSDRGIFRYDNAHSHPGHADEHHRHRYDPFTWQEIKPPICVTREGWPTLGDVIQELEDWWSETGRFVLPESP